MKKMWLVIAVAVSLAFMAGCAQDTDQLRNQNRSLETALKQKENEIDALRGQLTSLRGERDQAQAKLTALEKERAELAGKVQASTTEVDSLEKQRAELENMIKNLSGITVEGRPEGNFIVIEDKILFAAGKADIEPKGKEALLKVADYLKKYPRQMIRIDGHTDSDPIKASGWLSNLHLAAMRAHAVYAVLKGDGIAESRMFIVGYGPNKPVITPEKTPADKQKNRRVEILMIPEKPGLSEAIIDAKTQ